jgi:hypothetical protein
MADGASKAGFVAGGKAAVKEIDYDKTLREAVSDETYDEDRQEEHEWCGETICG